MVRQADVWAETISEDNFRKRVAGTHGVRRTNLFGDTLADIGAVISGGIGLAPSGNINPEMAYPSMFELVHGSALDISARESPIRSRRGFRERCCSAISARATSPR